MIKGESGVGLGEGGGVGGGLLKFWPNPKDANSIKLTQTIANNFCVIGRFEFLLIFFIILLQLFYMGLVIYAACIAATAGL